MKQLYLLIQINLPIKKILPRLVILLIKELIILMKIKLAQFQAKETTDIPKEIYDEILVELKKRE